jgi:Raf kinase inhibitor-like YbhB/YbcL family protein
MAAGATVPARFTCDGANVSPPLEWSGDDEASSYAIVVSDPDAPDGTFIHWVAFGIDPSVTSVDEGTAGRVATMGTNGFGDIGYGGPCPPEGDEPHRYRFTVYALGIRP